MTGGSESQTLGNRDGRRALDNVTVVDFTHVMAGPYCTMLLADMGANVVKIEPPGKGDLSRQMDPLTPSGESGAFLSVNRNKKSVALNLKSNEGRRIAKRLITKADVLVENFRPGVAKRLEIDYDSLATLNDRLIYCSISGFGATGPYAERGGFDLIAQGMSGLMSVTGESCGPPVKCGVPVTDLGAALFATYGILSALIARADTGRGQFVSTSLFEAGIGLAVWEATEYFYTGRVPRAKGSAHRLSAPYQAFRTSDGHITVGADGERMWPRFCEILGASSLSDDERFRSNALRLQNLDQLVEAVEAKTSARTSAYWLALLERAGIPAGKINSVPEALADPQAVARGMVVEMEHIHAGAIRVLGPVVKLSDTPARADRPAPTLGQDTHDVLVSLGIDAETIDEYREKGIVK